MANAAAAAVDFVGLPEARINLAHATVHLATAPKSNSAYAGLNAAMADVQDRPAGEVPMHLRDSSYGGAKSLGHGDGYRYPHDYPGGHVLQQYLPEDVGDQRYFHPTDHGEERRIADRMTELPKHQPADAEGDHPEGSTP